MHQKKFYQLIIHGLDGDKGEVFFESIAMFTFLLLIGKYLEFRAKSKALLSNANLNKTIPNTVNKLVNKESKLTLVNHLLLGDVVLIKAGEHIAIDGEIIEGNTSVNEAVLNGEFNPIAKQLNDKVYAGSINNDGVIKVKVTALGDETRLAKISELQTEFSSHNPEFTEFADKIAHRFVSTQLILAVITYLIWYFYQPEDAFWVSLSVLVATCPCALSLATPTAYTCIISTINRQGILIKDPKAFDKLTNITHVAFDKTGTLTQGKFSINESQVKKVILNLQQHSEHPIAKAFNQQSLLLKDPLSALDNLEITDVQIVVGEGVSAIVNGQMFKIGKSDFCLVDKLEHSSSEQNEDLNVFAVYNEQLVAMFVVKDEIKSSAEQVINDIHQLGLSSMMLTGDPSLQADEVTKSLNINQFIKSCSPEQKAIEVSQIQKINTTDNKSNRVLMVGDGINDAPVFSASDVSIAMASGADITKFSADIIILKNNLSAIVDLFNAAHRTRKIIKQNLNWSLIYNMIILPVAMFGYVAPYVAVIGMSASSILVVSNSLRLLKAKD